MNHWGLRRSDEGTQRNDLLQKAVGLYLNELKSLKYISANVSFTSLVSKGRTGNYWDDDDGNDIEGSTIDQLKKFDVRLLPPNHIWITIEPG